MVNFPPGRNLPPPPVDEPAPIEAAPKTTPTTIQLTLPQAVGKTIEANLSIKAASWGVKIAGRDVKSALAARMPVVRFQWSGQGLEFW